MDKEERIKQIYLQQYNVTQEEFEEYPQYYKSTLGYAIATVAVNYAETFEVFAKQLNKYLEEKRLQGFFQFLRRVGKYYEQVERERIRALNKMNYQKKRSQRKKWHKYRKRG